jgi:hypothetical protein
MAQRSRFFDSVGGDRVYGSDALAQVVAGLIGDGVVAGKGSELAVGESSPPAMSVSVGTGVAFVQGYYFEVYTAAETLAIAAAHATLGRIDLVVVKRDLANRTAVLAVKTGTPAASPAAPALTQAVAGVWEIALAQVSVPAADTAIQAAQITDLRGTRAQGTDIAGILSTTTGHDHDGVDSKAVAWGSVSGKPTAFAPDVHDHGAADPEGQVPWANISGKPAEFDPLDHAADHFLGGGDQISIDWSQITGEPATFAPSAHTLASHTSATPAAIGAWAKLSAGGGAAGVTIHVGTTAPASPAEGDIWIKV